MLPPLIACLLNARLGCGLATAVALSQLGETALPALIELLEHADQNVRVLAVQALGFSKQRRAIAPLRRMLDDQDAEVRWHAQSAVDRLYAHLIQSGDPFADDPDLPERIRWLRRHFWEQYRRAGMPYGDTPAGLRRWWDALFTGDQSIHTE